MCGIVGYSGAGDGAKLNAGLLKIAHRGPDDSGIFLDKRAAIGLGHTRLSILDLTSSGHQPMMSADGEVALVFNGEIYNFSELRHELEERGVSFRGTSDTEVLLQLYLTEGHDFELMLRRMNGIFAFAIWDSCRQKLLVARDAFGVKPLYFSEAGDCFLFSSEIKALLPLMLKSPQHSDLDHDALYRYLTFLWSPGSGTPIKSVRKLGPGEAIIVERGRVAQKLTWYSLPVFRDLQPKLNTAEAVRGTFEHLRTAVHRQMVADVPVGAFLSGGLDSSSVVALAREVNPDICCFTIDTEGGDAGMTDDLPYARRVAEHLNVPLEVVKVDSERMAAGLVKMVEQLDEPLADPAPLNVLFISQLARSHGVKVLLSGAGGDDLFTGYRRHRAILTEHYWDWLPYSLRSLLNRLSSRLDQRKAFGRRLRKLFDGALLESDERLVNYFTWIRRDDLNAFLSDDFLAALGSTSATALLRNFIDPLKGKVSRLEQMLALEQRFFLTDHNLTYTDKMSMAAGIEVRVPFLDLDLVEFASRIPAEAKQRGREGKWVLKKAMESLLPQDVIYRPKAGFGTPLRRWMRFELRELLGDLLSEESLRRRGIFKPQAVQDLISANDTGRTDASYTLLSLLCVEIWCRSYID